MDNADYSGTVAELGTGDRFRFEGHAPILTVSEASISVDGAVVYLTYTDGSHDTPATYRRIRMVERAPMCPCGDRYEYCGNECPWPDGLWAAAGY